MDPSTTPAAAPSISSVQLDDWTLKCVIDKSRANSPCEISQVIVLERGAETVEILNIAVSRAPDKVGVGAFTLVALVPNDVHLPSDFGLSADGFKLSLSRYRNCNRKGCFVVTALSDSAIRRLKRGKEGAAFFRGLTGQAIKVPFSLKGFTKAFDGLAHGSLPASSLGAGVEP